MGNFWEETQRRHERGTSSAASGPDCPLLQATLDTVHGRQCLDMVAPGTPMEAAKESQTLLLIPGARPHMPTWAVGLHGVSSSSSPLVPFVTTLHSCICTCTHTPSRGTRTHPSQVSTANGIQSLAVMDTFWLAFGSGRGNRKLQTLGGACGWCGTCGLFCRHTTLVIWSQRQKARATPSSPDPSPSLGPRNRT